MRIVAGSLKGRVIVAPTGRGVRPTLEMVREAIFDILGPEIKDATVLDLFAGSGALGLEALSRGARFVVWCDDNPRACDAVRQNCTKLRIPNDQYELTRMPALDIVARLGKMGRHFDIVFVDPPYEAGIHDEILLACNMAGIIVPDGRVVAEHARRFPLSAVFGDLVQEKDRRYGDTCVAFYRRRCGTTSRGDPKEGP